MSRAWTNALADVSYTLSTAAYTPVDLRRYEVGTVTYNDSGTVPASSPYKQLLDRRPQRGTFAMTLDGSPATIVEWGTTPGSAGTVAVNYSTGELQFHSGNASDAWTATYKDLGSVFDSNLVNTMQRALQAVTDAVGPTRERIVFSIPGIPGTGNAVGWRYLPAWSANRTVTQITVSAGNLLGLTGSSNTTLMAVSTIGVPGSIVHNTNGVIGTALSQSGANQTHTTLTTSWALDTSSALWLQCWCTSAAGGHGDIEVEIWVD